MVRVGYRNIDSSAALFVLQGPLRDETVRKVLGLGRLNGYLLLHPALQAFGGEALEGAVARSMRGFMPLPGYGPLSAIVVTPA